MPSVKVLAFDLPSEVLARDYRGCGKAWAAIKDGQVVALRYMDHRRTVRASDWAEAVAANAEGLDGRMLPTARSSRGLAKLAEAAQACADCPKPPRRDRFRPRELLQMARKALADADAESFARYRAQCREDLAKLGGEVVSGMASGTQFVVTQI